MLSIDQARRRYGVDFDKNSVAILSSMRNCSEYPQLPINSATLGLAVVAYAPVKWILEEFGFEPGKISSGLKFHLSLRNTDRSDNVFARGINLSARADEVLTNAARKVRLRSNYPEIKPKDLLVALASTEGITRTI